MVLNMGQNVLKWLGARVRVKKSGCNEHITEASVVKLYMRVCWDLSLTFMSIGSIADMQSIALC